MSSRPRTRLPPSTRLGNASAKPRGSPRAKAPSPEEWERIKPIVQRHYIDEGKKLVQVLDLLLKEHGFKATLVNLVPSLESTYALPVRLC